MNMCEAFGDLGHNVVLLVPDRADGSVENIFEHYGVERTFDIQKLPWDPLKGYQYSVLATVIAYRNKSDLVYSRSIAGCYFSSKIGLQTVYESHAPADKLHPITDRMFRSLIRSPSMLKLVVISDALGEYYLSRYNLGEKILTAHDAADPTDGKPIDEIKARNGLQAGYVGQLYEGKGMGLISDLAQKRPDITFHIVGGTDEDIEKWQSQTAKLNNIVYHGFVPPNRVPDYQASFDVLLAPYQREVYGSGGKTDLSNWMSPLKIFEYMAAERPIICSDLPVLCEVLQDGDTAYLCPPDDISAWSQALSRIKKHEKESMEIASRAKQVYEENYTFEKRAEKVLSDILK